MPLVRFGSEVVLKHSASGRFLSSPGVPYTHPNTSRQEMVVCQVVANARCHWIVKPPDGYPDDYLYGQPVAHDAFIRLENRASRKNLHSHADRAAPVTGKDGQREVTCFGDSGKGDLNDNWRVEIEPRKVLQTNLRFRLIHTLAGHALHSHAGAFHPQFTLGEQEVTGYTGRDENDMWIVEAVYGPIVAPHMPAIGAAANLVSVLNVAASVASITGVTFLCLGAALKTTMPVTAVCAVFSSLFSLGIAWLIGTILLQMHRWLTLRPRLKAWRIGMWLTCGVIGPVAWLYAWHGINKFASSELMRLLQDSFGLK